MADDPAPFLLVLPSILFFFGVFLDITQILNTPASAPVVWNSMSLLSSLSGTLFSDFAVGKKDGDGAGALDGGKALGY